MGMYDSLVAKYVTNRNKHYKKVTTNLNNEKRNMANTYYSAMKSQQQAYDNQQTRENDGYANLLQMAAQDYATSSERVKTETDSDLHKAYLRMKADQQELPQMLSSQFITGGMAESTLAGQRSNYGNQRAELTAQKLQALKGLEMQLTKEKTGLRQNFNDKFSDMETINMQREFDMKTKHGENMSEINARSNKTKIEIDEQLMKNIASVRLKEVQEKQKKTTADRKLKQQLELALAKMKK